MFKSRWNKFKNQFFKILLSNSLQVLINEKTLDEALEVSEKVDALLLDSGNPNLAVKELGGTGRVHNWVISRQIVEQSKVPVFLAGGLKTENVRAAIDAVQPFGLDLCSGVRTDGKLDPYKLEDSNLVIVAIRFCLKLPIDSCNQL